MRISDWSSDVCSSDLSLWFEHARTLHDAECCASAPAWRVCGLGSSKFSRRRATIAVAGCASSRHRTSKSPAAPIPPPTHIVRSEEHTSELQSLMRNSYAVFCLKKKTNT